jgi:hypothetical protein
LLSELWLLPIYPVFAAVSDGLTQLFPAAMMVALAESPTLLYIMAGAASQHHLDGRLCGTCANADRALYHEPDENPQHEYYPLAPLDLTSASRRRAQGALRLVWESRRVAVPVAGNPHHMSGGNV